MPLDALIKFRCKQSLADRLEAIANHPKVRRDVPDLLRIALSDYADNQERELGLCPLEPVHIEAPPSHKPVTPVGEARARQYANQLRDLSKDTPSFAADASPTAEQLAAQAIAHARDTAAAPVSYAPAAKKRARKPQSP